MEETELVPSEANFRQGDIIKIHGAAHAEYGVILNSDCDLANNKIDGHIAYAPLYTFQDFIERYWSHDQLTAIIKKCQKDLESFLKKEEIEDLIAWLSADGPDEVINKIKGELKLKKSQLDEFEKNTRKLHACHSGKGLKCLKSIYALEKNPEKHAESQLSSLKANLGEGHMMISSIAGLPEIGFVIRMKRIFSIEQDFCFKDKSEYLLKFRNHEAISAVRIARLANTYKYKFGQIFSSSFTRIGLPDEISRLNDLAIMEIVQNLREVKNV